MQTFNPLPEKEFREIIRRAGIRMTRQRQVIWNLLSASDNGYTIQGIVDALSHLHVGTATIYRNVVLLERLGLIRRVRGERGEYRFVRWRPGHRHALVCTACDRVVEFEPCGLEVLERLLQRETGFSRLVHYLEMHGLCPTCRESKKELEDAET